MGRITRQKNPTLCVARHPAVMKPKIRKPRRRRDPHDPVGRPKRRNGSPSARRTQRMLVSGVLDVAGRPPLAVGLALLVGPEVRDGFDVVARVVESHRADEEFGVSQLIVPD